MKYLVFLGMIISLIGISSYIKEVLKGSVRPNRVSWLIWSIAPLIATFAALSSGVTLSVVPVFMSGFGPLLVFIICLFKKAAYWKLQKFDYYCGSLSVLALIFWGITKEPIIAIVFAIASDFLASIPTIVKSYKNPETESSSAFIGALFSATTSFFAIEKCNFSSLAFPIYLVLINILLIFSIKFHHIFKKKIDSKDL